MREGDRVTGLSIHAGLWTSAALNARPRDVPVLRRRLAALEEKFGFDPKGHTGKALTHALMALPHDLVVAFPPAALEQLALTAMSLADRPRPALVMVSSALARHLFAFVWLPRDDLTTARRVAIGEMLGEAANGAILNWSIALEDGSVAMLRYTIDLRGPGRMPDHAPLEDRLERMVRGWAPAVEAALATQVGPSRATRLTLRHARTFPLGYRNANTPEEAALDIVRLADLADADARSVRLYQQGEATHLKLYRQGGALALSDAVPVLENFGFRVIEELPTALTDDARSYVHEFVVDAGGPLSSNPHDPRRRDRRGAGGARGKRCVQPADRRCAHGAAIGGAVPRLVPLSASGRAPLWPDHRRRCAAPRARGRHRADRPVRRRARPAVAGEHAQGRWRHRSRAGGGVRDRRRPYPARLSQHGRRDAAHQRLRARRPRSAGVQARQPSDPRPARARAMARNLGVQPAGRGHPPARRARRARRAALVRPARRFPDRNPRADEGAAGQERGHRPDGREGGFYPKLLPSPAVDRDAWFAEGTESYRIFIRSLLSITDNIVEGRVVHPEGVTILDGEDPYFVVAADKGTATFSDVANALALERDFWLGDAFASGGSVGYDHKAMGITARGAWISVQRHFAERGVDVQTDPITVVGCGDMSGDVFGNGMLLSKTIKLVAAFDHRHIFIDPNPDAAASWAERARMFALPRSSWADYDKSLISPGGGVFARTDKVITLSPEAKAVLGITDAQLDPGTLIGAILKAPADLLWFGGIGTYVKAAAENNVQVGDPANDRLRVDAEDLRVTAIGEGANLGITQAARIAFAQRGGRINTDFIDNSAGVDCSDNEVNIKIALNREMIEGRLSFEDRNSLLASMTDDVAHLVLEDNRLQTLALSIAEADGPTAMPSYVRVIEIFETAGRLDRKVEGLSGNDDLLRRGLDGHGLTRPELAVLLATAKLALQDAIEQTGLGSAPELESDLVEAFPTAMQQDWRQAIEDHRLRGEIVATKLANRIVNRLGILNPFELAEEEGAAMGDIVAMFVVAEELFGLDDLWVAIETTPMPEAARIALFNEVATGTRSQIADLLRATTPGAQPGAVITRMKAGIASLDAQTSALLRDEAQAHSGRIAAELEAAGAPADLSRKVVRLFELDGAIGLADLGDRLGLDETDLTRAFTHLGQMLGLDWAQATAARIVSSDPWERLLIAGLARDFQQLRLEFLARGGVGDPQGFVAGWLDTNAARVAQFRALVDRARQAAQPNAAMLAQIAGQARVLLGR